jgi:tetratricopeptide (TPR) repeat protein
MNSEDSNEIAWLCALGPYTISNPESPVRLAEAAVQKAEFAGNKAGYLNTLGGALYRAGRFEEAIRRLEEAIRARGGGRGIPGDWAFLAMAHHRLGNREEARRWLDRLADYRPSEYPIRFWYELEIRLLRSEAEAVVLYDPVFPDDPFAP